jgi:hypothetical protein
MCKKIRKKEKKPPEISSAAPGTLPPSLLLSAMLPPKSPRGGASRAEHRCFPRKLVIAAPLGELTTAPLGGARRCSPLPPGSPPVARPLRRAPVEASGCWDGSWDLREKKEKVKRGAETRVVWWEVCWCL